MCDSPCNALRYFIVLLQAYVRAFKHVYEEQLKYLMTESRVVLQQGRHGDGKKSGSSFLNKLSTSTADIRSSLSGSMSSLSPARGGSTFTSQSVADFGANPALGSSSAEAVHGIT